MSEYTFRITGMDCAGCARTVESGVAHLPGVERSELNFTTETLRVQASIPAEQIAARVRELGYNVAEPEKKRATAVPLGLFAYLWQRTHTRLALIGLVCLLPGILFVELLPGVVPHSIWFDVGALIALALAGYPIALSAWRSVRFNHEININVLMTIAALGAVAIGAITEAGLVMVLFAIGEALEGYTAERARQAIRGLMTEAPDKATVLKPCWDCREHLGQAGYSGGACPFCGLEEQKVAVADLQVGDVIVVKPGERVAMDGRIQTGSSSVNQAPITGESRLVSKKPGDTVFASSLNGEGALEVVVTHLAADNTIQRLIAMVEEAQERRAPTQRLVDRFAQIYTPLVMGLAVLVAVLPPLFFGGAFWGGDGWLYRALALLVVACPCALVISTPVSLISALTRAAQQGVLFKGGVYLEVLSRVKGIAFDKTGTLTQGRPSLVHLRSAVCQTGQPCDDCDDLLALAGAVEQRSEHPLAQAVTSAVAARGVNGRYPTATEVHALTGRGVTGRVNGRQVLIASHLYFDAQVPHKRDCAEIQGQDNAGYTTLLVSEDDQYKGYLAVADALRPESKGVIAQLKELGLKRLVMLTGDNAATAEQIATQVGLTEFRANCLPADKVTAVAALRQEIGEIAMLGDGINDAPALATASVGIAIGNTAQTLETADITLMGEDLRQLPLAIAISRQAMHTIRVNVALALGIKAAFLLLVVAGMGSMWTAVLADVGTSLLVTFNGMRLLKVAKVEPHTIIT